MNHSKPDMSDVATSQDKSMKKGRRVLFVSPRPFGLMGTPGTYLLTESYAKFVDICILSNKEKPKDLPIVYQDKTRINLHEINFSRANFFNEAQAIIKEFAPKLVIIGNCAQWYEIAADIKEICPHALYVLDIKSPLIIDGDQEIYNHVQKQGMERSFFLDLVMTRCMDDVDTWIPECEVRTLVYPLGVKIKDYAPKTISEKFIKCRRFIYVGSIHRRRQLDKMIHYIHQLPEPLRQDLTFDFYGSGPALNELKQLVKETGLENTVSFKGFVDSETLVELLPTYDAGMAWVPYDIYNNAPSLKLLEYLASGLVPVAMDTAAHKSYSDEGFHIEYFTDTSESFGHAIQRISDQGFSGSKRQTNLEKITEHDWDQVASEKILPVFEELIEEKPENKTPYASNIYDRVCTWDLPINPEPPEKVVSSETRVAGIFSEKLYQGLNLECELFLLTPDNWFQILSYARPDFVLMESAWFSATDHWYMAQTIAGPDNDQILQIISSAKKQGLPTVFWMTMDHSYCAHFEALARVFDVIFCADPLATDIFAKNGIEAKTLLPAVQPVLFNPIRNVEANEPFDAGTLFNGWVDLFRFPELGKILKKFTAKNLNIFQTTLMMYKGQLLRTDKELMPYVQGTVPDLVLPGLLKSASMYLAFEKGYKAKTQKTWDILEAAACRIPIAYLGSLTKDDQLRGLVRHFENEDDFCSYVNTVDRDSLEVEKERHAAWRKTFSDHVFAKRLQTICNEIGIAHDWEEFPRATLVSGTMRSKFLPKCFEQFNFQTYPNKEFVLVFNGDAGPVADYQKQYADNSNIHIASIPSDHTVGTVLNYGVHKADGKYFFRIDDDDYYGPNYILDTLLYLRAVNADIFGKRASFFHFEGEEEIYLRDRTMPSVKSFPARMLHKDQEYLISGCSFAASVSLLKKYRYPDDIQASVDTALVERIAEQQPDVKCLLVDNLNLVVERASDVASHTWRIDADAIKRKSKIITRQFEDLIT
ncbi:MAG: glycosyltransferase [Desulfobacteraceae bacterium]|nr:glycosyltransferase [Desulfobacteraceae bacterium]